MNRGEFEHDYGITNVRSYKGNDSSVSVRALSASVWMHADRGMEERKTDTEILSEYFSDNRNHIVIISICKSKTLF